MYIYIDILINVYLQGHQQGIVNIDKYLHSIHKTDTYYDDLYNNSHISYNLEYKNENIISKLSYSEKIKKWKEIINK